jgi:REP element-mobilizing transposase RayT
MDASLRANQWTIDLQTLVVMPDHVHMIFTPLVDLARARYFPSRESQTHQGNFGAPDQPPAWRPGRVWQEESFDPSVACSEKLDEKIAYILDNPVREGLASSPNEYRCLWVEPRPEPSFARLGR